jgi:hypothetical protein
VLLASTPEEKSLRNWKIATMIISIIAVLLLVSLIAVYVNRHSSNSPTPSPTPTPNIAQQIAATGPNDTANYDLNLAQVKEQTVNNEMAMLGNGSGLTGSLSMGLTPNTFLSQSNLNLTAYLQMVTDMYSFDADVNNYTTYCENNNITLNSADMQQFQQMMDMVNSTFMDNMTDYNSMINQLYQQNGQGYGDLQDLFSNIS